MTERERRALEIILKRTQQVPERIVYAHVPVVFVDAMKTVERLLIRDERRRNA